jgi:hypothetical protein
MSLVKGLEPSDVESAVNHKPSLPLRLTLAAFMICDSSISQKTVQGSQVQSVQEKPKLIDIMDNPNFHVLRFGICFVVARTFEETNRVRIVLVKLSTFHDVAKGDAIVLVGLLSISLIQKHGVTAVFSLVALARKID